MSTPCLKNIIYKLDSDQPYVIADNPLTVLSDEQVERLELIKKGIENSADPLICGIQSMGTMIWAASMNNQSKGNVVEVSETDFANIGWMIKEIGDVLEALNHTHSNAVYTLHQNELIKAEG